MTWEYIGTGDNNFLSREDPAGKRCCSNFVHCSSTGGPSQANGRFVGTLNLFIFEKSVFDYGNQYFDNDNGQTLFSASVVMYIMVDNDTY